MEGLKEEVGMKEACAILGVGKYTVLRYISSGLIAVRNVSSPDSSRKKYKLLLSDVMEIRNRYCEILPPKRKYKYIDYDPT